MDANEFLWGMYLEHANQGRHHENQRANVTTFIIVVAGGILAFIANKDILSKDKWPIAVFLIIVGLFGALFSAKQYERFRYHMIAAGTYRQKLEQALGNNVRDIREDAQNKHVEKFPTLLIKLRLYYFWIALHLFIAGLGVMLLIITTRH
jgi:hypothetical protein